MPLNSLGQFNDIAQMFTEVQIRAFQLEFQFLAGDSYNASFGSPLPEIISAVDPTASTPPTQVAVVEAYGNSKRQVLTQARPHTMLLVPRPAVQVYGSPISTVYAIENNSKALWYQLDSVLSMPFYGALGILRNFANVTGCGATVRISGTVQLAVRRPH